MGRSMDEAAVVGAAYLLTYGLIVWYALALHRRHRRLTRHK
ncbi:MAG: hypothetical protein ACT4OP_09515 [Actinomycetota bacterium]